MCWLFFILCGSPVLQAALEIIPHQERPFVFPGTQTVTVAVRNSSDKKVKASLQTRLYQENSATIAPFAEAQPWKTLEVLAGQTILENVKLDFPSVRAATLFEVHWLDERGKELGKIRVQVCPDDLLKELGKLGGTNSIGVLDPDNLLKPLLQQCQVEFEDLDKNAGFDRFRGRLVVIGPFTKKESVPDNLKKRIQAQLGKGLSMVWIQPPALPENALIPIYVAGAETSHLAIVQDSVVSNLAESPQAQLQLIRCAQMALHHELSVEP